MLQPNIVVTKLIESNSMNGCQVQTRNRWIKRYVYTHDSSSEKSGHKIINYFINTYIAKLHKTNPSTLIIVARILINICAEPFQYFFLGASGWNPSKSGLFTKLLYIHASKLINSFNFHWWIAIRIFSAWIPLPLPVDIRNIVWICSFFTLLPNCRF